MQQPRVIIAGAGLAGLSLGQCLKAKGIPAIIFEKASDKPRYNYGVTLHSWVYEPLLPILGLDHASFRDQVSIDPCRGDPDGELKHRKQYLASGGSFRCHRGALEMLLRQGLDIDWEHTLTDVQVSPLRVTLHGLDGQETHQGRFLIGADGVHSLIRTKLTPKVEPKVLPYVVLSGRTHLSKERFDRCLAPYANGELAIEQRIGTSLFRIAFDGFSRKGVLLNFTYSRPARLDRFDPLYRPERTPQESNSAEFEELFLAEIKGYEGLKQPFADIFDPVQVAHDRTLHWLMRSLRSSLGSQQYLANESIFLIGDAAYAMPILGSEGANSAIRDAVDLASHLARIDEQNLEDFVVKRHRSSVAAIDSGEQRLFSMHSCLEESL